MIARYTRPDLLHIWSDQRRFDTWLSVELAACEAMETAKRVPAGTAVAIRAKAAGHLDPADRVACDRLRRLLHLRTPTFPARPPGFRRESCVILAVVPRASIG